MSSTEPLTTGERLARVETHLETLRRDLDRMRATVSRAAWAGWVIVGELAVAFVIFLARGS